MAEELTYLELSEAGGSHKFYEVRVAGPQLTIRFGRIGDAGKTTVTTLGSEAQAQAEAQKKIAEKLKKGYERATQGVRKKRAITRRVADEAPAPPPPPPPAALRGQPPAALLLGGYVPAPLRWRVDVGGRAFGLFVDRTRAFVGTELGLIHTIDLASQKVTRSYRLPDGVKCLIGDGDWRYAGCDDGRVYDISGSAPRVAYEIADDLDIYWLDIRDGVLAISDAGGGLTVVNHEDESLWRKDSPGARGWMVRCDEIGVYHGHSRGVTMYDWESGARLWDQSTDGMVFFGWQEEATLFVATTSHKVQTFSKRGEPGPEARCDHVVYSCAAAADGERLYAADLQGHLYGFVREGGGYRRQWKIQSGCGAALSMQARGETLYIVTNTGALAAVDLTDAAMTAAAQGGYQAPRAQVASGAKAAAVNQGPAPTAAAAVQSGAASGVVLECFADSAGKLRVRVVSPGYRADLLCQFPRDLRRAGARFLVDEVRESVRGGFYRVLGDIRPITDQEPG